MLLGLPRWRSKGTFGGLEIGDRAPDFTLKDQHNGEVSLASFRGRQAVVLIFYPATFTGICQGELAAVQDDLARLQNDDVQVMAVSVDSPFANKVWAEQQGFTLSDPVRLLAARRRWHRPTGCSTTWSGGRCGAPS